MVSRLKQGAGHADTGVTCHVPHCHGGVLDTEAALVLGAVMSMNVSHKRITSNPRLTEKIHERLLMRVWLLVVIMRR